jgi:hypothetical protein
MKFVKVIGAHRVRWRKNIVNIRSKQAHIRDSNGGWSAGEYIDQGPVRRSQVINIIFEWKDVASVIT